MTHPIDPYRNYSVVLRRGQISRTIFTVAASLIISTLTTPQALAQAQPPPTPLTGTPELEQTLDKLNTLGSLLMLGAHPDDENTAVISYFARGRHIRAAYLAATRGEGGQNLIGPEQGELMGLIRTQELLAARRIDGGEQFFTRALDYGFSKTPDEAYEKWGRERLLSDMVRIIRRFRPDVIVTRFPHDGDGGHGQHTAVGHISPEAFEAAADPSRFPGQIAEGLQPWQAKRLYWNTYSFSRRMEQDEAARKDRLRVDTGQYDPVLGKSYAEIAGESRSQHRSQSMGASQRKGPSFGFFAPIEGDLAERDLFDGIDTTWGRVAGGAEVGRLLAKAREEFQPEKPDAIVPVLVEAWQMMSPLNDPWVAVKKPELLHAIELAAGLWLEAEADRWDATAGAPLEISLTALNRSSAELSWVRTEIRGAAEQTEPAKTMALRSNQPEEQNVTLTIPADTPLSQPVWITRSKKFDSYEIADPKMIGRPESPPVLTATFVLKTASGVELPFEKAVHYRWVDDAFGERVRTLQIVPDVAVSFTDPNMIFAEPAARRVAVQLTANVDRAAGSVKLDAPAGWNVTPPEAPFELKRRGQQTTVHFELSPPQGDSGGTLAATVITGGKAITHGMRAIEYPHIPIQVVYPKAQMRVERINVRLLSKKIGYVMGAGDLVPDALRQLGAEVTLLSPDFVAAGDLSKFDAIVTGVRAMNTRDDLVAARERFLEYVHQGGTLVVQYNTASRRPTGGPSESVLAPYPMTASHQRVTVEEAPVTFPNPDHSLLQAPNHISERDFEGWVQERGLYFMSDWDPKYDTILSCHDPGEEPQLGGMLYAKYGKGVYIFTGYSWFRQLPAGVPGAYRIFANLVSAGKVP